MLRIPPPGGSSQGTFLIGRHNVTSCSESYVGCPTTSSGALCIPPSGMCTPGSVPPFTPSSVCHKHLVEVWGWIQAACSQQSCALPMAKPAGENEVPMSASDSSTERGHVEPAEKQGHREILCGRSYYDKQGKKKKEIGGQESVLSLFQCFPYFPPTLITSVSPYLSLITSSCPEGIINT